MALSRHAMERSDVRMDKYVPGLVRPDDLAKWKELSSD